MCRAQQIPPRGSTRAKESAYRLAGLVDWTSRVLCVNVRIKEGLLHDTLWNWRFRVILSAVPVPINGNSAHRKGWVHFRGLCCGKSQCWTNLLKHCLIYQQACLGPQKDLLCRTYMLLMLPMLHSCSFFQFIIGGMQQYAADPGVQFGAMPHACARHHTCMYRAA